MLDFTGQKIELQDVHCWWTSVIQWMYKYTYAMFTLMLDFIRFISIQ